MRREFAVVLRDSEGAFLEADRVFGELGLDIMRVSYNKIVDVHTCFVEVEGTAEALAAAGTSDLASVATANQSSPGL